MIRAWRHLWVLIVKEFLAVLRDPKSRIIIFAPPLIQLIIFANTLTMETQNIKILAVDYSNTLSSRNFISQIKASSWFDEVGVTRGLCWMDVCRAWRLLCRRIFHRLHRLLRSNIIQSRFLRLKWNGGVGLIRIIFINGIW